MAKHRAKETPEDQVELGGETISVEAPRNLSVGDVVNALDKAAAVPVVAEAARAAVTNTSVWQRNRTSIANIAGILINMIMLATTIPNDSLSPLATAYIAIAVQGVAAIIGVFLPDAISKSQAQTVVNYVDKSRAAQD